jgi:hypothetical protein
MHAWFRSRVPSVAQPGHWYGGESCIKIRGGNTKKTLKNLTLPASTKKKAVPPLARKKAEPPPSTHLGGPVLLLPHLAAPLIFPHLLLPTISLSLSLWVTSSVPLQPAQLSHPSSLFLFFWPTKRLFFPGHLKELLPLSQDSPSSEPPKTRATDSLNLPLPQPT